MKELLSLLFIILTTFLHAQNFQQKLQQAQASLARGEYSQALTQIKQVEQQAKALPNGALLIQSLHLKTELYQKQGETDQSWQTMQEALDILEKQLLNDCKLIIPLYLTYGELLYEKARYHQAVKAGQKGIDCLLAKTQIDRQDTLWLADYYYNVAIYYSELNDIDKSLDYSLNALEWHQQTGNEQALSDLYHNMGNLFYKNGRFQESLRYILQGRDVMAAISVGEARDDYFINCNAHVASTYRQLGNLDSAFVYIQKSESIHQRRSTREEETYKVFAELYLEQGKLEEAEQYARRAVTTARKLYSEFHPIFAQTALLLAKVYQLQDRPEKAKEAILAAFKALDMSYSGEGYPDPAQSADLNTLLEALQSRAQLERAQGMEQQALQSYEQAVKVIDRIHNSYSADDSKLFLFQRALPVYEAYIELCLFLEQLADEQPFEEKALAMVERNKSLLLQDALRNESARLLSGIPDSLLHLEEGLYQELAQLERSLFEAQRQKDKETETSAQRELLNIKRAIEKLQQTFSVQYPKYYELRYKEEVLDINKLKERLGEDQMLIEYFVGDSVAYVFSLSQKEGLKVQTIKNIKNLNKSIQLLRQALTDVNLITNKEKEAYVLFTETARDLFKLLLEPHLVEGITRLQIVPDGNLNHIPFEVLLTQDANEAAYQDLSYLIKGYTVNYQYAATLMLRSQTDLSRNKNKVLALGPTYLIDKEQVHAIQNKREKYVRGHLNELPGALSEVDMLQGIFHGEFIKGVDANESSFRQMAQTDEYAVLHLAMHGLVDTDYPEYSSLVFSKTDSQQVDDMLYAYELSMLDLKADLVVLSACETGYGKYQRGEGVLSIGRGFMYAGVPALGMTLWPLNDRAAAQLMMDYYDLLCADYPKDIALQKAKLNYLENNKGLSAHPFFWAGFVNLGDEGVIEIQRKSFFVRYYVWVLVAGGLVVLLIGIFFLRKVIVNQRGK